MNLQHKYGACMAILERNNKPIAHAEGDWLSSKMAFRLVEVHQKHLIHLPKKDGKSVKVRRYLMDFELTAPVELLRFGYFAGFGEKNAGLWFGCVGVFRV